jgi:hypothetical protein
MREVGLRREMKMGDEIIIISDPGDEVEHICITLRNND